MRQLEAALRQLAERAEPLPTEVLIARIETELGWAGAPSAVAEREEPTMVTREQPDIEIPTPTPPPRSRRGPLVAAAVAVVVILAGVGHRFRHGSIRIRGRCCGGAARSGYGPRRHLGPRMGRRQP